MNFIDIAHDVDIARRELAHAEKALSAVKDGTAVVQSVIRVDAVSVVVEGDVTSTLHALYAHIAACRARYEQLVADLKTLL